MIHVCALICVPEANLCESDDANCSKVSESRCRSREKSRQINLSDVPAPKIGGVEFVALERDIGWVSNGRRRLVLDQDFESAVVSPAIDAARFVTGDEKRSARRESESIGHIAHAFDDDPFRPRGPVGADLAVLPRVLRPGREESGDRCGNLQERPAGPTRQLAPDVDDATGP